MILIEEIFLEKSKKFFVNIRKIDILKMTNKNIQTWKCIKYVICYANIHKKFGLITKAI